MALKIVWSAEARLTYLAIIEYLKREWTENEVINFVQRAHDKVELLSTHPRLGRVHKKTLKIHKTLIHKRVSLVYHVKPRKKELHLLSFWDDRQDPARLRH